MGDNLTAQEDLLSGRLVRPFTASMTAFGQYALVCERVPGASGGGADARMVQRSAGD
jgi:hypothetical protein